MTADFKQAANLAGKILASGQVVQQVVTVLGTPTGGAWTPYISGTSCGTVAYNASAATLQTALRTVDATATVTGSAGGPYTVTLAASKTLSMGANALTGGTNPSIGMSGVDTTIYTVPAASAVTKLALLLCNISTSSVVVSASVVPSGGSVDGTHRIVSNLIVNGNGTVKLTELLEQVMLDTGAQVVITASAAGQLDYLFTGAVSS